MSSVHATPLQQARRFAGCALDALGVAEAFDGHDDLRAGRALDDALAGLEAARHRVEGLREARRTAARDAFVGAVLTIGSLALFIVPGLPNLGGGL